MDTYSLNLNIEDEVKSYGVEDKLNDYIAVQKQVIPILEKENFYGYVKNETTGVEIDIKKTKEKNKFWMHNIRITEKNSQLLSPAQCQDVHEIGNSCNHIIAQKNENASENLNVAYLSNKDDFIDG